MTNKTWLWLVGLCWLFVFSYAQALTIYRNVLPPSYWLAVEAIEIEDARSGEWPKMRVLRHINRTVFGTWIVTVRRMRDDGEEYVCDAPGSNRYKTGTLLPKAADSLGWWMEVPLDSCPGLKEPGQYSVGIAWTLYPVGYPQKEIERFSNVFTIR